MTNGVDFAFCANDFNFVLLFVAQLVDEWSVYVGERHFYVCVCQQFTNEASTDITCAKMNCVFHNLPTN
jgi:hypothetical protein